MKYKYTAKTRQGELQAGFVEAPNKSAAANILSGHNLFILSVEESEKGVGLERIFNFINRVKTVDLMVFTRQFAILMESGVPLGDSLESLFKQTKNPILKEAVYEISQDVNSGLSLSQALERQGKIFFEFYINMVKSAEITGRLNQAMAFLANYLEKEVSWRSKLKNAMIYPAFIIVLFAGVAVFILTFVFPKLTLIFEEVNVKLPLITRIFLNSGNFLLEWWWVIAVVLALLLALFIDYLKTLEGKAVMSEIIIRLPVFGNLFKKMYITRFAESLSVLIKGGIPIAQSIEITGHTIGNIIYRDIFHSISEEVKAGQLLSSLLSANERYFPPLVSQMVAIGEGTGRLEAILSKISDFYGAEVDNYLNNLTELIQPILITVIGAFIGLLFASVLIPIYNLMQGMSSF